MNIISFCWYTMFNTLLIHCEFHFFFGSVNFSFSDRPANPFRTQCFSSLFGLKWWEQMMTVGCFTPWDDFGKRMTESDKATADCNICPPQVLHSLSRGSARVTLFDRNCSTCRWLSIVILKLRENPQSFIWWTRRGGRLRGEKFTHCPDLNDKCWTGSKQIIQWRKISWNE